MIWLLYFAAVLLGIGMLTWSAKVFFVALCLYADARRDSKPDALSVRFVDWLFGITVDDMDQVRERARRKRGS